MNRLKKTYKFRREKEFTFSHWRKFNFKRNSILNLAQYVFKLGNKRGINVKRKKYVQNYI